MAFDPDKLSANQKIVYAHLVVQCGAERAQELIESLDRIEGKFRKAYAGAVSFEKSLSSINSVVRTAGSAMNSFTGFINASNISLKAGLDISMKYRDSFVQTYAQMQKYGITVAQYSGQIEKLRKTYNLTYQDAMKLSSSLETSFNMTSPGNLKGYLEGIRNVVGYNIDGINEFRQALEGVVKNNPIFQQKLQNKDFAGAESYAAAMLASGQLDYDTYKKFLELKEGQNRSFSEQKALEDLQRPANTIRALQVGIETGVKEAGDTTLKAVNQTYEWANGLGDVNNTLSEIVNKFTFIQSAMNGLSGGVSGGLNLLDAAADLKYLGGGKLFGKAGGLIRGAGGLGVRGLAGLGMTGAGTTGMTGAGAGAGAAGGLSGLGVGAAIVGAAAVGFGAGLGVEHLGERWIGGSKDLVGNSFDFNSKYAEMAEREHDPIKKARMKINMLDNQAEKEKFDQASGWLGKGLFGSGLFKNKIEASDETKQAISQARAELASMVEGEKKAKEQLEISNEQLDYMIGKTDTLTKSTMNIGIQLRRNDFLYQAQQRYLESSNKLLSSQLILRGKAGNIVGIGSSVDANNEKIAMQEKNIRERLSTVREQLSKATDQQEKQELQASIDSKEAELNSLFEQRVENANSITFANKAQEEQLQRAISLQEANIALQDSAGLGLRAQVGARKELVDQLNVELSLLKQQESNAQQQKATAEQALGEAKTQDEADRARRKMYEADKNILEIRQKQTATVQKQADVTKSMREGWISAINAMTTGAGVFTRIVIDQNSRLGNLAFSRPDKLKALRMGGAAGGRTESALWTPGGFKEGGVGAWEQSVLSNYGINPKSMVQDAVNAMMKYQEEKGSKMSSAAAAFGIGPQGTAEVTSAIAEGVKKAFDDKSSSTPKMIITEKDLDEIKRSFVDAFSKIGTEIVTETLKRIKDK